MYLQYVIYPCTVTSWSALRSFLTHSSLKNMKKFVDDDMDVHEYAVKL